ncbi:cation:dicarboxylate symporter family transporter [Shigella flexneri]
MITTSPSFWGSLWRTLPARCRWTCRSWRRSRPQISEHDEAVQSSSHGIMGTILSLVPTQHCGVDGEGEMPPIIFFSVLFGLGSSSLPATHREPLVTVFRSISEPMFKVTHMVMRYALVGVFALIAVTAADFWFLVSWPLANWCGRCISPFCSSRGSVLAIVARLCGLSVGSDS